jgi:hypothetical protein
MAANLSQISQSDFDWLDEVFQVERGLGAISALRLCEEE